MPLTNYSRKKIVVSTVGRGMFGHSSSSGFYLALSVTQPGSSGGNVVEPSASAGYKRVQLDESLFSKQSIFPSEPDYDATNDIYSLTNAADIVFPEAISGWGTLSYFAIFDQSVGGNVIAYGTLATPITPQTNTVPIVRAGQMTISEEQSA